jgi:hypothetical protein
MFNEQDAEYFRRMMPNWQEYEPGVPERNPRREVPVPLPPGTRMLPLPEGIRPSTPEDYRRFQEENPPAPPYKEPPHEAPEDYDYGQEASYDDKGGLLSGLNREPLMAEWEAVYEVLKDEGSSEEERAAAVKLLRELRERSRHWDRKKEGRAQQRA